MGPSQICGCSSVICPFEIAHWSSAALSLQKAVKFSVLTGFCQLSVFNQVLVLAFQHSSQFTVWIPFWKVKSCHAPGKSQEQERSKFWTIEPSRAKKKLWPGGRGTWESMCLNLNNIFTGIIVILFTFQPTAGLEALVLAAASPPGAAQRWHSAPSSSPVQRLNTISHVEK